MSLLPGLRCPRCDGRVDSGVCSTCFTAPLPPAEPKATPTPPSLNHPDAQPPRGSEADPDEAATSVARGSGQSRLWSARVQGGQAVYERLYERLEKADKVTKMATTYRDGDGDGDADDASSFEVVVGLAAKARAGGLIKLSGIEGWDSIKETRRGDAWRQLAFEFVGDRARRVAYEKRDGSFVSLKPSMGPARPGANGNRMR